MDKFEGLRARIKDRIAVARHCKRAVVLSTKDSDVLLAALDGLTESKMPTTVFSPAEVESLWRFQMPPPEGPFMHPFTCPNRGDGQHITIGTDLGMLVPTVRGWICPFCSYTQDWAHSFMKVGGIK